MNTNKKITLPLDGLAGLKQNWSADVLSGFMVSLLALPLSLGIAKASDFPNPMYGVLTAIIGGMVVSIMAGSKITIKGPAAGLIVIIAGAVSEFGGGETGWHMALGAIVAAAVVQVLFGVLKLGKLGDIFPLSAVHGMLAAIGLIIISKQLHILLGVNPLGENGKPLVEPIELIEALPHTFATIADRMPIVITGLVCLAVVFGTPLLPIKALKKIPVPMIVLLVAIPLAMYLGLKDMKGGLVKFDKPFTQIIGLNVSFDGIGQMGTFIKYVILFALIGSLESLLTVKAIDGLDPFRRKSNANKDLIAVGAGNVLAGILGGLPMISEVARSSANVNNGAKTRWANFFHGVFLLIFMLFLTPVIQLIPNAALAAMLIGVGFKLAHPKEFLHTWHIGKEQFVIFVTTIVFTLGVDLLVGVGAGILVKIIMYLASGVAFKDMFKAPVKVINQEGDYFVDIEKSAVFTNWLGIKKELEALPSGSNVHVNLAKTHLIDHSTMENLHHFKQDYEENGGQFSIAGLDNHASFSDHKLAARKKK
ncbi:MAG: SulP family inorganic anion transporter [Runella slithyformis]|nr:MAG: SulP family inorganic anion transporter [Runella slithyformis]TAF96698.1 MAG: SulP family inorganic anion transporter [Runella sp.]TAG21086.1 MAG: SulP family inorganic anion transporter [Cytophagales bacterium]TAG40172.1 MAG: SulP family inorganic anion transporter [Cytophagia bacterium]TAF27591.1 MAG: SulP family inorganic anion transporter [Runella slithyformis]